MKCPWCNKEMEAERRETNGRVLYLCKECGKIVGAYLLEYEDYLLHFFDKFKKDTFIPKPTIYKR